VKKITLVCIRGAGLRIDNLDIEIDIIKELNSSRCSDVIIGMKIQTLFL